MLRAIMDAMERLGHICVCWDDVKPSEELFFLPRKADTKRALKSFRKREIIDNRCAAIVDGMRPLQWARHAFESRRLD